MTTDVASTPRATRIEPLRASPDGRSLVDGDGAPFFWLADTAWQLFVQLDRDESLRYLDDRAAKGFTVIQAVAHGKILEDWATVPSRAGVLPFVDGDPLRADPAFFAHVDWVIERALERGIRTALLPAWAADVVVGSGALHVGNAEEYGRWIGDRYRDHGVIWMLGGDISPERFATDDAGRLVVVDDRPVYDALAAGILAGAGSDALLTYHPSAASPAGGTRPRTSAFFGDRNWLGLNLIQSGHLVRDDAGVDPEGGEDHVDLTGHFGGHEDARAHILSGPHNHLAIAAEYRSEPTRPVIDGEPRYEDHPIYRPDPRDQDGVWRAPDVRRAAYHALFAGAAGHTYGHASVWDFYGAGGVRVPYADFPLGFPRPDWEEAIDAPGAGQMRHAKALMLSRSFANRVPDDAIVIGHPGVGGEHASGIRDTDGAWAFVYLPSGGPVSVDLTRLSGPVRASWFDPRTGSTWGGADADGGTFTAPTSGPDDDWVLVLDADRPE